MLMETLARQGRHLMDADGSAFFELGAEGEKLHLHSLIVENETIKDRHNFPQPECAWLVISEETGRSHGFKFY